MKRCTHCGLPETHETIAFDEAGVCNICRQHEFKGARIDWASRKQTLDALVFADMLRVDEDNMGAWADSPEPPLNDSSRWLARFSPTQGNHGFMNCKARAIRSATGSQLFGARRLSN